MFLGAPCVYDLDVSKQTGDFLVVSHFSAIIEEQFVGLMYIAHQRHITTGKNSPAVWLDQNVLT